MKVKLIESNLTLGKKSPFCIVQSKFSNSNLVDPGIEAELPVTKVQYGTLLDAFRYFDTELFDGSLPEVLITLQRHHGAASFSSPKRFRRRDTRRGTVHEIALNPDTFNGRTDEQILSNLAHEMVHIWQHEYGRPGRGRYHNREWSRKMHSIGLMPSTTSKAGGAPTGDNVSHYILENEPFSVACRSFLQSHRLVWESVTARDNSASSASGPTRHTRTKFTCPICGLNVWGKPDALVACVRCTQETGELIVMVPNLELPIEEELSR